jgi:mRNA interferase MazF
MDLRLGDIVLIEVRFHQAEGAKVRPAIIVLDTGDADVVAAPVTSRSRAAEFDWAITGWQGAGLNVPSVARVHKIAVVSKAGVRRVVGRVPAEDLIAFRAVLCRAFCPSLK